MSLKSTFAGTLTGFRTVEELEEARNAEHMRQVREKRIRVAREWGLWEEIPADLVERGKVFVSASSDAVYRRVRGLVFASDSASVVASEAPYFFTVDESTRDLVFFEKLPETWTQTLERKAERERRRALPRRPIRRTVA